MTSILVKDIWKEIFRLVPEWPVLRLVCKDWNKMITEDDTYWPCGTIMNE